jgi:hypothetical protein
VSLTVLRGDASVIPAPPSIVSAGDSVLVTTLVTSPDCPLAVPTAGFSRSGLVVTISTRFPDVPAICPAVLYIAPVRVVVRSVPAGRYRVVVRRRYESATAAPQEAELFRGTVAVP